jgi:uncharacterized membrane protein YkoI
MCLNKEMDHMDTSTKRMVIAAAVMVIGATVVVGGMVWSGEKERKKGQESQQMVEIAMAANVTIEQAVKTALENFPGKAIEAELKKQNDKMVWAVEIVTGERDIMGVRIDAESGSVIATEEKMAGEKREGNGRSALPRAP